MSDTIARLAALRSRQAQPLPNQGRPGRLSPLMDFGSNPGGLASRFYRPKNLPEGAPLVVVLHGCTQNAETYDHGAGWSRLADPAGFALLYPEQVRPNNPNLCFNWFLPDDTRRDSGEALSIRQMIEAMIVAHDLDRTRIFITGLSAGGAMACAMLAAYPDVFAGGAIIAGLAYGSATTIPEAFDRMRGHGGPSERELQQLLRDASAHQGPWPKLSIWQGAADHTVAPSNAQAIAEQWRRAHRLEKAPTHLNTAGRRSRHVWCNADGEDAIEINMIAGMGHGTPLASDGLCAPGPYMLDVGISSTQEIARGWGIVETGAGFAAETAEIWQDGRSASPAVLQPPTAAQKTSAMGLPPLHAALRSHGIGKIIDDALRTAGLKR